MSPFSDGRARVVLVGIAALLVGMIGRVAYLQTYGRQKTIRLVERQQYTATTSIARRGTILSRNGYPMAATVQTTSLYVDPQFLLQQYQRERRNLNQMDSDLRKMCKLVECNVDQLIELIGAGPGSRYLKVAENVDQRTREAVESLHIPGVGFEPMLVRYYPMGSTASHVLGTVGADGKGLEGLELKFEHNLAGKNGFTRLEKDARRRPIGVEAEDYVPPSHGQHLVLTIDANIQMLAEEELADACEKFGAKRGEVIVIDPKTGEILALANWPTFNPQNLVDSKPEDRLNRAIVVPYEPGSTLKPFIMGPALAWNITRANEVWPIQSATYIPYGSRHVTDTHYGGPLCSWDVLVKSSNIGMSMLAERMGNAKVREGLALFGFGRPTGLELPGEDEGRLNPLKKWNHFSTESVAQGYEMMVTPLQLARAFCVYANGGRLVRPRLIQGILDADGNVVAKERAQALEMCPQVVDAVTAAQVRRILCDVVIRGTAQGKGSKYWNIFGKTGTAHISMGKRGYDQNLFNSSFMGGAPAEDPKIVVAMVIHEADRKLGHFGGTVSAPAAVRVIERTMGYLQVPQSPPLPPPPADVTGVLQGYHGKIVLTAAAPAGH
ncbi:MAG TPA: penicillin-binding protein 2 [Tepidisphaeraceae bacterium]|jgi:cell division protein FtsI (penicillin-binding protein 3)|nr:penicillin-binding protein 2 [Tepidisphaeraceae bacterium]